VAKCGFAKLILKDTFAEQAKVYYRDINILMHITFKIVDVL